MSKPRRYILGAHIWAEWWPEGVTPRLKLYNYLGAQGLGQDRIFIFQERKTGIKIGMPFAWLVKKNELGTFRPFCLATDTTEFEETRY